MTRLTEDDVRGLTAGLLRFESGLVEVSGLTLRALAARTVAVDAAASDLGRAAAVSAPVCAAAPSPTPAPDLRTDAVFACVPVTTGEGLISGFSECVAVILRHMGWRASVTAQADVRGIQEAVDGGAEAFFMADDHRFVAVNVRKGRCVDDDPATAHGYVTALEAAAGGLADRPVLLLGLGPVGRAAADRLLARGARLLVVEPDCERVELAGARGLDFKHVELAEGLRAADLILDATPAPAVIGDAQVGPRTIAAVPGVPSAFTGAAQARLGVRHIHEPLAIGVAVMAARALA
ncbi:MAG: 3-methylornithyl-N6-L-lysine dehydrogenase PylD [Thermoleophilia bacterium]|nr:3-methylornithyl-N6-L-lysine dehydrogenase PylD [Thermoleophilia bacterium]